MLPTISPRCWIATALRSGAQHELAFTIRMTTRRSFFRHAHHAFSGSQPAAAKETAKVAKAMASSVSTVVVLRPRASTLSTRLRLSFS